MRLADYLNRIILIVKLLALLGTITILSQYISFQEFVPSTAPIPEISKAVLIILLAFGYQFIIPSLLNYVGYENGKIVKYIILTATSLACVIFILWVTAIIGFIDIVGHQSFHKTVSLDILLSEVNKSGFYLTSILIHTFFNISLFASFLAISIGFIDFIIDAFKLSPKIHGRIIAGFIAFLPAWLITVISQVTFLNSLAINGFIVILFYLVLPASTSLKYFDQLIKKDNQQVAGGKILRIAVIGFGLFLVIWTIIIAFIEITQ